ncbi:4-hydroxythreonine-4-phosphate dehydrogenase PdxA [Bradyrhizobium tunisiense]|uniref:4-hydroxythreonine-4-phosphate dehydrogenase PdxA n=1 Tax=Bradyrhizobium tunisiense TaxID=3278709 RepID=UPI0035E0EE2A
MTFTDKALRGLGLKQPKIVVAALNPHAREGGLFGRQDIDVSEPNHCQDGGRWTQHCRAAIPCSSSYALVSTTS